MFISLDATTMFAEQIKQGGSEPRNMNDSSTIDGYGFGARAVHWLMAIMVLGMFALGYWMRTLGYYDPWYQRAPELHKSIGVILIGLLLVRIWWRARTLQPAPLGVNRLEIGAAHAVHMLLYLLLTAMAITGYLFATGDGKPLSIFGWIDLPSLLKSKSVADFAGMVHEWLAYGIISIAALHMLAALKHHFIDRDETLRRMVKASPVNPEKPSKE